MSGIVGIINLDGAPVDRGLLREMTRSMGFRGPDAQKTWTDSHVGLGHAMLRTTFEMAQERQPWSLDGELWITADARIDAREELVHRLESKGCRELAQASDADLILHAYRVWGTSCVDRLLGDFSFAIWDAGRQRLFCARDHFGVRPFYYASVGGCLIFSNDLDAIRRHPRVSDELNDLAIVNFWLFRYQPRIDQTSFRDIQSLPPAHTLTCEGARVTVSRYWALPIEQPIRYKHYQDYVERFRELLDTAVAERMRTDRAGILMSGGLDSSSIAATIRRVDVREKGSFALEAFTYVYDRLIPDEERHYATLAASGLDLPIRFAALDDKKWFDGWDREGFRSPEPMVNSPLWNDEDFVRKAAVEEGVRVFYSGWGPDLLLNEPTRYGTLLRHGRIGDFFRETGGFIMRYRQRPLAAARRYWQRLRGTFRERRVDVDALAWLAPGLVERINIPKRWWQFPTVPETHPWRPSTYSQLTNYYWTLSFQQQDAGYWRAPVEFRYPYFDIRLVQYLLRVPVLPWFSNKKLLREAMRGVLPEPVRSRAKAPVAGEPSHCYAEWVHRNSTAASELSRYLDTTKVMPLILKRGSKETALTQRIIALNHWLRYYNRLSLQ